MGLNWCQMETSARIRDMKIFILLSFVVVSSFASASCHETARQNTTQEQTVASTRTTDHLPAGRGR